MSILSNLLSSITNTIKSARPPFPEVPAVLMLCDIKNRSGLSAISLGTAIISRLPEIGIPNGVNADGSENLINKFCMIVSEEVVNEIKRNGISINVTAPGEIQVTGTISPSPNGMVFVGTNSNMVKTRGGLQ